MELFYLYSYGLSERVKLIQLVQKSKTKDQDAAINDIYYDQEVTKHFEILTLKLSTSENFNKLLSFPPDQKLNGEAWIDISRAD